MKHTWHIHTSCGVIFESESKTALGALKKCTASEREFEILALVRADMAVTPDPARPITVIAVANRAALKPKPEGY